MNKSFHRLPSYLQRYCVEQDYSRYTSRDHAAWRYIMRQSRVFFRRYGVPVYIDGLKQTAITTEQIPRISDMDEALSAFGWGAVPVCGFIPPAAFLEFQARAILPIAADMRTLDHIGYTPAPDIVHEAAGHAPILADAGYRDYLQRYARMAQKAIMSSEDIAVYEAIRVLSDIKENPDTTPPEIKAASERLEAAQKAVSHVTEATKVARMAWWTVEYGLVGPLDQPLIFGAGLLSSVRESQDCLSPQVRKIPLSVACVETSYDITEPQPQLFVAENMQHLSSVLTEFERTLSYATGGIQGLNAAQKAKSVNTIVFDNGLSVSGALSEFKVGEASGAVNFVKFSGPCQLAFADLELEGQGTSRHAHGFSTPLGLWVPDLSPEPWKYSDEDLRRFNMIAGERCELKLSTGFVVSGILARVVRAAERILYVTWKDCTVKRGDQIYFAPQWGEFDMPVGNKILSVFGGPADKQKFGPYEMGQASTTPGRQSPFSAAELKLFERYRDVRAARQKPHKEALIALAQQNLKDFPQEWLIHLEMLEILAGLEPSLPAVETLRQHLEKLAAVGDKNRQEVIHKGLGLLTVNL